MSNHCVIGFFLYAISIVWALPSSALADRMDDYKIGAHGQAQVKYPAWFKDSFYDLVQDLEDAEKQGKRGIILFLSQESCNHCQALLDTTFKNSKTEARIRKRYDVIGMDIFSERTATRL